MAKNILIFSDGTGQVGGLRPDQRLSNVYKMYRAMRPGPSSSISPNEQVCFYDAGLGAGEIEGFSFKKIRNALSAAVGTGIDENVIDCYEKIISYYEPGDKVLLFGFSRGAYTVRSVANVMNLCGIPTKMPDCKGSPIPQHGPKLRKIASDAVNYVYNHGNGYPRGQEPYFSNREELGRRFRQKYSSFDVNAEEDVQGNVQPTFIGVYDTVAALGNAKVGLAGFICVIVLLGLIFAMIQHSWHWLTWGTLSLILVLVVYWYIQLKLSQWKYFSPDENRPLNFYNPLNWPSLWRNGHYAKWNLKNYDKWLDSNVKHARHALSIDENRKNFPRVKWAMPAEASKTTQRKPEWLKQVWFAGCHSDVGGSYPEPESRLSDIALKWMIEELKECVDDININSDKLYIYPDASGMQHEENVMISIGHYKKYWPLHPREINPNFPLHESVVERLEKKAVSHMGELKPYRPKQLEEHHQAKKYYKKK